MISLQARGCPSTYAAVHEAAHGGNLPELRNVDLRSGNRRTSGSTHVAAKQHQRPHFRRTGSCMSKSLTMDMVSRSRAVLPLSAPSPLASEALRRRPIGETASVSGDGWHQSIQNMSSCDTQRPVLTSARSDDFIPTIPGPPSRARFARRSNPIGSYHQIRRSYNISTILWPNMHGSYGVNMCGSEICEEFPSISLFVRARNPRSTATLGNTHRAA